MAEHGDASDNRPSVPSVAGRWRLLSWHTTGEDGSVKGQPFGERPHGMLIYTPGGAMAGQVAATSRAAVDGAGPLDGPPEQRAAAYSSYVAYCGRYVVAGDRIIHYVDTSLIPGWAGTEQVRYFSLTGDILALRTPPTQIAGATVTSELTWQRIESW